MFFPVSFFCFWERVVSLWDMDLSFSRVNNGFYLLSVPQSEGQMSVGIHLSDSTPTDQSCFYTLSRLCMPTFSVLLTMLDTPTP